MKRLVIVRHGESEWNQKNLFTGWVDVELSDKGRAEAKRAGQALRAAGIDFDICFTSYLRRAINTQQIILKEMDREWLPVYKSFKLNERHYGALSGLNKKETAAKYGEVLMFVPRRWKMITRITLRRIPLIVMCRHRKYLCARVSKTQ